jgi:hypothetical protein
VCGTEQGIINRCNWQQQQQQGEKQGMGQQQQQEEQGMVQQQQQEEEEAWGPQQQQQEKEGMDHHHHHRQQQQLRCLADRQLENLIGQPQKQVTEQQLRLQKSLPLHAGSVVVFSTSPVFVDHLWQLFAPLLCGTKVEVLLVPEEIVMQPRHFVKLLRCHRVTHLVSRGEECE